MGDPNCKMCSHESACTAWKRHGKALNNGFDYVAEHCPHRLLNIASDASTSTVRLIDANALPVRKEYCVDEAGWGATFYVVNKEDIDNAPTIDPDSLRPKGRWIKDEDEDEYCNNCGRYMPDREVTGDIAATDFCPNCGADMRGWKT